MLILFIKWKCNPLLNMVETILPKYDEAFKNVLKSFVKIVLLLYASYYRFLNIDTGS
jgi:hypothetical protein